MFLFSCSSVYFDSIIGMGKTGWGFFVKLFASVSYLVLLYCVVEYTDLGLKAAWGTEIYYWFIVMVISIYFMFGTKWKDKILEAANA
jgi:Na+-driven multidrug efflux pump